MRFRQKPTRKSTIYGFCIIKIALKTNEGNKEKRIAQLKNERWQSLKPHAAVKMCARWKIYKPYTANCKKLETKIR